jgi:uncharacterized protein (TIGR02391 family)
MNKKEAIEFLKAKLSELGDLETLPYNNNEYPLWHRVIAGVLREVFGNNSHEYRSFAEAFPHVSHIGEDKQKKYREELQMRETAILSIIQVHELVGIDTKPSATAEPKDMELPVHLFDRMQFHPKVVEASKSCFVTINYREAILNTFISLIDHIKEISGLDLDGDDLMNKVFSFYYDNEKKKITRYPIICINELKNRTDRDEQQGFMFLCKGAAAFVRNPKAHRLIAQTDPLHTLEHLAFASMLFKQLDKRVPTHHKE